jgi:Alcohol dehydrogenase GroES-like domain/Alcohol dehydrogenase GroES-associated
MNLLDNDGVERNARVDILPPAYHWRLAHPKQLICLKDIWAEGEKIMKALVYNGPRDVSVKKVPDAKIERPNDVVVKITTTNICGSDLHMYEGRTDFKPGSIFGHENTGEVVEVGPGISRIKKGDQVSLPF